MNDLIIELCRKIEKGEGFMGNEKELVLMDAEEFEKNATDLEDKVEDLEWAEDDYFTIDKDDVNVIMSNVMRKMFYPDYDDKYNATNEEDFESFIDDAVRILKLELEKKGV